MRNDRGVFRRRLHFALKASAAEVQDEARQSHEYQTETGLLERSVKVRVEGARYADVYLDRRIAKYGSFVHRGTRAHTIRPRRRFFGTSRRALSWSSGGSFVFAKSVRHPGTKPNPFLYRAYDAKRGEIDRIFLRYTNKTLEEVVDAIRRRRYLWGDELLGPLVDAKILQKAEEWFYYFVARQGVEKDTVTPSFPVQELIAAYAYREVCLKKSYGGERVWTNGEDGDYYSRKLKFFDARIRELESRLTVAELTGDEEARANAYAEFKVGRYEGSNVVRQLFQRVQDGAFRLLSLMGIKTRHDILARIATGEIYKAPVKSGYQNSITPDVTDGTHAVVRATQEAAEEVYYQRADENVRAKKEEERRIPKGIIAAEYARRIAISLFDPNAKRMPQTEDNTTTIRKEEPRRVFVNEQERKKNVGFFSYVFASPSYICHRVPVFG